jgi:arylsulfatase A-like enzyme
MMDRDLSREVKTLFELLRPSRNIFGTISRGTGVHRNAFLIRRVPWTLHYLMTGDWAPIDDRANGLLLRAAERRRERFTFHVTLQVDEHSHSDGPFSPRVREGYRAFDRVVGQLVARLRMKGMLHRTLIVLGSDHGHSEVDRHFDLELFFEKRGFKTLYYPKAFRHWFDCEAAVMVGGNGMGHVYLRGAGWNAGAETPEERIAAVPGLIDDLLAEDAVDILAWRTGTPEDGVVRVRSRRGAATIRLTPGHVRYAVDTGDPFGYGPLPETMSRREALVRTHKTEYPDGLVQLAQLFGCARAGDLVVSAARGWDLREHHLSHPHRSGHGSLHREHMLVPFAMNHPFDGSAVRTVDAFPTILSLLGEEVPARIGGIDGVALAAGYSMADSRDFFSARSSSSR